MRQQIELRKVMLSAIVIGLFMGIFDSIPIIWLPNYLCLWIILGGFATTAAATWRNPRSEPADGLIIGGIFGIVHTLTSELAYPIITTIRILTGFTVLEGPSNGLFYWILKFIAVFGINLLSSVLFGALGGVLFILFLQRSKEDNPRSTKRSSLRR